MMSIKQLFRAGLPIIQAPMAGGISTPSLVAAVANAGAIGSFGFAYSTADEIDRDLRTARALTTGVINANFFVFAPVPEPSTALREQALAALAALPIMEGVALPRVEAPYFLPLDEQLAPVWAHKPEVLTFHFGVPDAAIIDQAKSMGIAVGVTATNLVEAQQIADAGADFIVAQGDEAGGHRGTFDAEGKGDEHLSTAALTSLLHANISLEIVSAGGIMNGDDIAAMIDKGATAVQLGTAFLCCDEAGTNEVYRDYLLHKADRKTRYTRGFSGRLARSVETEFTIAMADQPTLPFPIQNTTTGALRKRAVAERNGEYQSLWAGTGFDQVQSISVAALLASLSKG